MKRLLLLIVVVKRRTLIKQRPLTNLECVALAHIGRGEPCTRHELRLAFEQSAAGRYSGSAGAIYPLVSRLEAAGLISSKSAANGEQKKRLYSITNHGREAVRKWMFDLDPRQTFADDPLKTRLQYLMYFTAEGRRRWIDAAIDSLGAQDAEIRYEYENADALTEYDQYVLKGVLAANRLRRKWLEDAKKII